MSLQSHQLLFGRRLPTTSPTWLTKLDGSQEMLELFACRVRLPQSESVLYKTSVVLQIPYINTNKEARICIHMHAVGGTASCIEYIWNIASTRSGKVVQQALQNMGSGTIMPDRGLRCQGGQGTLSALGYPSSLKPRHIKNTTSDPRTTAEIAHFSSP